MPFYLIIVCKNIVCDVGLKLTTKSAFKVKITIDRIFGFLVAKILKVIWIRLKF